MAASHGSSDCISTPHQRTSTSLTIRHTPTTTTAHSHKTRPVYTNCSVEDIDPDTAIEHELEPQIEIEPKLDPDTHPSCLPSPSDLLRHSSVFSTREQPNLRDQSAALASSRQLSASIGHPRDISTGHGMFCAGEAEMEGEDPHVRTPFTSTAFEPCLRHYSSCSHIAYRSPRSYHPRWSFRSRTSKPASPLCSSGFLVCSAS
jgi:hypothetical protein